MKKIKLILLIAILIIPFKVSALEASLELDCNPSGLHAGETATCTISGTSDGEVTGLEAIIDYDGDAIEISGFTLTNAWESAFGVGTITSGTKIEIIANANEGNEVNGEFEVATFTVSLKDAAESSEQQISLSSIAFYDVNVAKTTLTDPVAFEFTNFFSADDFEVDNNKMVIYRIPPITVGTFKSTIITNAILSIFDLDNNPLDDLASMATGQLLRVAFKGHNDDYKLSVVGDTNGDSMIDDEDAVKIAEHIIDGDVLTGDEYLMAADYDNNGEIKMNDVMRLLSGIDLNPDQDPETIPEPEPDSEPE